MDFAKIRTAEIAAATAVVGYDLLTGERENRSPGARKIKSLAYVGSAAAGDTVIELFVNGVSKGKYANSATGVAIDQLKDVKTLDVFVPRNALIEAKVVDAASTNAVVLEMEFSAPSRTGGNRRRAYYRRPGGTPRPTRRY